MSKGALHTAQDGLPINQRPGRIMHQYNLNLRRKNSYSSLDRFLAGGTADDTEQSHKSWGREVLLQEVNTCLVVVTGQGQCQ
jgi:hypothetical protein